MYSIFLIVPPLFLFRTTFAEDLGSDKESYKNSLMHVDQFLEKVGQKIQSERNYLNTLGGNNAKPPTTQRDTTKPNSKEAFASLWSDDSFQSQSNPINKIVNRKTYLSPTQPYSSIATDNLKHDITVKNNINKHPNFMKALASLDINVIKMGSTKKLSRAVLDLKGLMKHDMDIKSERNQKTDDILKRMKEKQIEGLKETSYERNKDSNNVMKFKARGDRRGDRRDYDVFGKMIFPSKSEFPVNVLSKTSTKRKVWRAETGQGVNGGVVDKMLAGHDSELKLNEVGYTAKLIEEKESLSLKPEKITSTSAPAFFKNEMVERNMGAFSVAILKLLDAVKLKNESVMKGLASVFVKLIKRYGAEGKLDEFGQPFKKALIASSTTIGELSPDDLRTQATQLHNTLLHRRKLLSRDLNSILDHIDTLYQRDEIEDLADSLEPLAAFSDSSILPYKLLDHFVQTILEPWERIKGTSKGAILKEALNRATRNHIYPDEEDEETNRRKFSVKSKKGKDKTNRKKTKVKTKSSRKQTDFTDSSVHDTENTKRSESFKIKWFTTATYAMSEGNDNDNANLSLTLDAIHSNTDNEVIKEKYKFKKLKPVTKHTTKDWTDYVDIESKKTIEVNKETEPPQVSDQDISLQMETSRPKKHHKKHRLKHKHKHNHRSLKHKLAKILKFIKMYRKKHKRNKHRKHHHKRNKHKKSLRTASKSNAETIELKGNKKTSPKETSKKHTEYKSNKDRRFHDVDTELFTYIPPKHFYEHTTQVYEIKDYTHFKKNMRRNQKVNKPVNAIRQVSEGTDEEIPLKTNLYKAMAISDEALNFERILRAKNKKGLLSASSESCTSDEEAILKNKIYSYFQNIPDL